MSPRNLLPKRAIPAWAGEPVLLSDGEDYSGGHPRVGGGTFQASREKNACFSGARPGYRPDRP